MIDDNVPQTMAMQQLQGSGMNDWYAGYAEGVSDGQKTAAARIESLEAALRDAAATPTAWRVWWVSLNTARTELFEDHAKATAKARETGGCVIPLFTRAALAPEQKPLTGNTIDPANPMPDDPPSQKQPKSA